MDNGIILGGFQNNLAAAGLNLATFMNMLFDSHDNSTN